MSRELKEEMKQAVMIPRGSMTQERKYQRLRQELNNSERPVWLEQRR